MRVLLLTLLLAAPLSAATINVSITTTARQDQVIEAARVKRNTETCARYGLPASCTSAQVVAKGGPAASIGADAAGFFTGVLADYLRSVKGEIDDQSKKTFAQTMEGLTAGQRNTVCTGVGLPTGCWP